MIIKDYHGFRLGDAIRDADMTISQIRMARQTENVEFIVGHGVIRNALFSMLSRYGFSPQAKLGNDGVIVCVIE